MHKFDTTKQISIIFGALLAICCATQANARSKGDVTSFYTNGSEQNEPYASSASVSAAYSNPNYSNQTVSASYTSRLGYSLPTGVSAAYTDSAYSNPGGISDTFLEPDYSSPSGISAAHSAPNPSLTVQNIFYRGQAAGASRVRRGLPPTSMDSFVLNAGGMSEMIYGDEGADGPPPYEGFDQGHRIETGIVGQRAAGLTTGHASSLPEAWGWPE